MNRSIQHIIAGFMTLLLLVIITSPLSTLALQSNTIAHALLGECTGDCNICGCSPERRASHTCCCWRKKLAQNIEQHEHKNGCCKKSKNHKTVTIASCCPCGNGKKHIWLGGNGFEFLPYHFAEKILTRQEDEQYHHTPANLVECTCEPPVPPPKQSIPS